MTEENDTGKHEYNFFLDKQIQQKLLEADEVIAAKETALYKNPSTFSKVQGTGQSVQISGANSNSSSAFGSQKINQVRSNSNKEKDIPRANISGWCVGPGVVYRKAESELPTRTRGQGFRDAYSRDSKVRPHTHNPQDFVFRHYADPRRYIEQYRKEHTCYDTTTTSATRNEFLETRRFYAYNQYSPLAVGSQNNIPHVNSPLPSAYQESAVATAEQSFYNHKKQQATPTLQYTNRRDQAKQTINASLRQNTLHSRPAKPGMTASENVMTPEPLHDSGVIFDNDIKRAGSARGRGSPGVNGVSIQKGLTSTPTDLDRLSARAHQTQSTGVHVPLDPSIPNQFLGRKLGQVTNMSGQSRTVDSLAYQAGEIGGKQISGDPPTASSGAAVDSVWCPEARLEQLRLVNRRLLLAPPAPHAPQLTFIKEGQEGEFLEVESNHFVPGWREKNSSCAKDKKCKGSRVELMPGSSCSLTVVPHFYCGDVITDTGDGSSSSNSSSLRPNGGSSEKTSLSSHHSGSSGKSNNNIINHKSAIKVKSVDHVVSKDKMCQPGDDDTTKQSNASLTPVPSPSVYDRLGGSQVSRLSWREKVKHQQQTSMTSSGDASFGNEVATSNRWALARREEELSSIAHARRIKHLIEQSRLRAGGHGVRGAFTFGRSFSDGGEERETESSMGGLKVEGLQQNKTQYNKKSRVPLATVTNGAQASSDLGFADMKNVAVQSIARVNKTKRTKNMTNDDIHKGDHLQLGDDTQFALPPVGKSHDKKSKDSPSDAPILGDLLDTQAFFSHGIPLNPAVAVGKKSHVHSSVPSDKNLPTKSNANNSSNASRNIAATIPASIDAVAVIGAQKHPKLKYSSSLSHKLTGGCSP